jgi:hypothetical protein
MEKVKMEFSCKENEASFTQVSNGEHCASCNKVVVDYTKMNLEDVLSSISKSPGGCGKFAPKQVDPYHIVDLKIPNRLFAYTTGLGILLGAGSVQAQVPESQIELKMSADSLPYCPRISTEKTSPSCNGHDASDADNSTSTYKRKRYLYLSLRFPFVRYRYPIRGMRASVRIAPFTKRD